MNNVSKIFLVVIVVLVIVVGFLTYKMLFYKNNFLRVEKLLYEKIENDTKIQNELNQSTEKVKVEIEENSVTSTGATIIITDNNEYPYIYKEDYFLQEKQEDGNFKALKTRIEPKFEEETTYKRDVNNQIKQVLNWEELYGSLPKGTYRVMKCMRTVNTIIEMESNEFEIK